MIDIRNIHTVKSGKKIFEDFNWKINANEHWVVNGANGSGKTSLLEVLSGRQHAQKGSIDCDFITGETWEEQFEQKRQLILYVPAQSAQALLPKDTDTYYQQRYYSIGDEINVVKVRDILTGDIHHYEALDIPTSFDIGPLLDRDVKRLSNGQLKKVLILQRLLRHKPRLLLLDYPFEGLDRQSRRDFCDFIDFIVRAYSMQVIIVDHGHELPKCISHRLTMKNCRLEKEELIVNDPVQSSIIKPTEHQQKSAEPVVEIRDLKIQYGHTVILKDLNWTVNRGERWALTGANGSGKTTLFSIIFADHPLAYSQQVYLFGKRRGSGESIWDIKSRVNYMGPELMSYLDDSLSFRTVREFVGSNDLLDFFDAKSFADRSLRQLSSGELQLALLMACFAKNKELLLLDEPFQFLSPGVRDKVADYLQQYLHEDTTLILITHYEEDLARWTERTLKI